LDGVERRPDRAERVLGLHRQRLQVAAAQPAPGVGVLGEQAERTADTAAWAVLPAFDTDPRSSAPVVGAGVTR
jgi:hypothetical protein